MTTRKALRTALGLAIAGGFLYMMVRQADAARIGAALRDAGAGLLAGAFLVLVAGYACRIARWREMLEHANPRLRFRDCAGPLLASFAANNVLPFRAGDILRSFAFNGQLGTTSGTVVATLFVERLLDLLAIILMLGTALWMFHFESSRLLGVAGPVLVLSAGAILLVVLRPQVMAPFIKVLDRLAARLPATARLRAELEKATGTLSQLAVGTTMWKLLAWSFLAWMLEGGVYWLTAQALPSITVPLAGWLALPVGTLATLIPSTPGYVGTFDFFTAQAMALAGNEVAAAAAFALLVHLVLWLPPTIAGGLFMLFRSVRRTPATNATEHNN